MKSDANKSQPIEVVQPEHFAKPKGYANGMITRGPLLHVAGQIGWNAQCEFETDDFVEQFAQTLDNILAVVHAAGASPSDIASMTGYIVNLEEYRLRARELGPVWKEKMGRHFPAMAFVGVAGLVEERAKIEIQATVQLQES